MAVDCRWRSLLHELTQATMTIGPTVVFWSWGLRYFFIIFYFDILAKSFLRQEFFILYLWVFWVVVVSIVFFLCFFVWFSTSKESIQFDDWLIFFNWVNQMFKLVGSFTCFIFDVQGLKENRIPNIPCWHPFFFGTRDMNKSLCIKVIGLSPPWFFDIKVHTPLPPNQLIFPTHRIHVWYIYLHLPYFTIKNNQM